MTYQVKCFVCGKAIEDKFADHCPHCGGSLTVEMDLRKAKEIGLEGMRKRPIGVWRYAELLPVPAAERVSLLEGGTPLYDCEEMRSLVRCGKLMVKFEGANPTGSFKDRGMTVGVSRAKQLGCKVVGCASTGNTSAALAAYAAKAGMRSVVLLPSGKVAMGKLAQAMFYGAKVITVDGSFDDALRVVRQLAAEGELYLLNSVNPFRPEGQKTIGFEVIDQFGVPDVMVFPVGNAANIWASYKGFLEYREMGWIDKMPRFIGVQAEGSAPLVKAFSAGSEDFVAEDHPETVATAIRIGNPASGRKALEAMRTSGGTCISVSDAEIIEAQKLLGRKEGIGVEPASAASIAGVLKLRGTKVLDKDESVVCVCTGHVLKDPDTVIKNAEPLISCKADAASVRKAISQ
jgi:threonine synthase